MSGADPQRPRRRTSLALSGKTTCGTPAKLQHSSVLPLIQSHRLLYPNSSRLASGLPQQLSEGDGAASQEGWPKVVYLLLVHPQS